MRLSINGVNLGAIADIANAVSGKPSKPAPPVKTIKTGFGSLIILTLLGLAFIGGGLLGYMSSQIDGSWKRADAKIVDVERDFDMYAGIYGYEVDGKKYEIKSNSSSNTTLTIGDTREVAYDPSDPDKAKLVPDFIESAIFLILPVLGLILVVAGIVSFAKRKKTPKATDDTAQANQPLAIVSDQPISQPLQPLQPAQPAQPISQPVDQPIAQPQPVQPAATEIPGDSLEAALAALPVATAPTPQPQQPTQPVQPVQPVAPPVAPTQPPQEESYLQSNLFGSDDTKI